MSENTTLGSIDDAIASKNDMKTEMFDARDKNEDEKPNPFDVDIETAPSDELMADLIEPVSVESVKEDIGQL